MNKVCSICEKDLAKYKCPICRTPFCSVACFKEHKKVECKPPPPPTPPPSSSLSPPSPPQESSDDEDSKKHIIPLETLQKLSDSQKVKDCLKNPQVRDIITYIANNKDPIKSVGLAMTESVFIEFADACLEVVGDKEWNDIRNK
ncbi:hypothetical protein M0802_012094 [Mischocyttarus mexicanus]|nr:hypothetical protein M0802_012094 [Mischocyttarus mexicanus]